MRKETKEIAIVAAVFVLCLLLVNTASADSISVPSSISASKTFDEPKDTTPYFYTSTSFTIENNVNKTVEYSVSDIPTESGITISPASGTIAPYRSASVSLTLTLSNSLSEGGHTGRVEVEGDSESHTMDIAISITHKAKLEVSPTSVTFDKISATESTSEIVTFSETLGYKSIVVTLERTGNGWVTASSNSFAVTKGGSETITFYFAPSGVTRDNCVRYHSWTYRVSSTEGAGSYTINLKGEICCPAKLSYDHSSSTTIAFNRPKTERHTYHATAKVRVSNTGCEQMNFKSPHVTSPSGGISLSVKNYPSYISGYGSGYIEIAISAPYNAAEGTHYGKLYIDAGDAGYGNVDITIVIKWPVDFIISSTSVYFTPSPSSIDFGSIELKEREYEKKSVNITLTEFYFYKPVRNLRISKSGEYGNWLKEERAFAEIPPGASRNITLRIEPGLEAVPKDYSWKYDISASEISAKRMEVKAKIIPLNITKMIEGFKSFRGTPLYSNYPSSEVIILNGVELLEAVERSEIGAEDWKKIPILMKGTLSLLSSLNDGIISSEAKNYGKAVESLWTASVSTSTIESNSELNNWDISGYAKDISAGADKTTEEVLMDEAKMLENRGWDIKKAVEHAIALDDISGLKEEENVLESALSYQYAATIYGPGLLNDKEKRLECTYEESRMMDKHDELVSDATDLRIKAENNISNSKENDLIRIRIGDTHLLLNPYKYDTFSARYGSAERYMEDALKKYKVAGELLMSGNTKEAVNKLKSERSYILSLFFLACILYAAAFIYAINRVIMGTVAYIRDMYEREVGDIVIT
ncbi:MAG: hypothetical protein WBC40_04455 [Halobacteriota archaeon]